MALDVELSPKRSVLDFLKPQAIKYPSVDKTISITRKMEIRDFFSSTSKVSTNKDVLKIESDKVEIIDDAKEGRHELNTDDKSVNSSSAKARHKVDIDGSPMKSSSSKTVRAGSKVSESPQLDMPVSAIKKAKLMTKKKGQGIANETEAGSNQKGNCGNGQGNSTIEHVQEIDYADFVKSFAVAQNRNSAGCDDSEKVNDATFTDHCETERSLNVNRNLTEQTEHCSDLHTFICDRKKDATVDSRDSVVSKQNELKTGVPNAFSFLMQARTNKKSMKSFDDDSLLENKNGTSSENETEELKAGCAGDENINLGMDNPLEMTSSSSTPSVKHFFSKCEKPAKRDGNGGGLVLVRVDVHHDPSKQSVSSTEKKKLSKVHDVTTNKVVPVEDGNEIVFLGTETIDIDEDSCHRSQYKKKDKGTSLPCREPSSETPNSIAAAEKNKQSTVNTNKKEFLQNSTAPPDKSVKKAQATLQFGMGGSLSMKAVVTAKPARKSAKSKEDKDEADHTHVRGLNNLKTRMRRVKRRGQIICDSDSGESNSVPPENESLAEEVCSENKTSERKMSTRQRKSLESESGSNSSKDFTSQSKQAPLVVGCTSKSRAQELLQRAKQQRDKNVNKKAVKCLKLKKKDKKSTRVEPRKISVVKTEIESSNTEQGSRRQSRRLAEQQKVKYDSEQVSCLTIASESDVDISSDETTTPQKKNIRKRESSRQSPTTASTQIPINPGKLAPIFAKKRMEEKVPEPLEDPEIVRRRREFLMSGVPVELKKPTLSSVPVIVTSEYIPFPEISHVQQRTSSSVWSPIVPSKMKTVCKDDAYELWEMQASELNWQNLNWQPTVKEPYTSHSSVQSPLDVTLEMQEALLKELEQTNPNFAFVAMWDKFKARLSGKSSKKDGPQDDPATANRDASADSDVIFLEEQENSSMVQNDKDLCANSLWPDVLQPKSVSEIIGNESSIQRLKFWLEEWKVFIEREARMTAKVAGDHSDSDFFLSGDDSDVEDSHLCNTMLLVGPHGVGKTAAAYALAHQLCYKVFEVNASSSRQGRHILAQLQEATQSHQVAQKKDGIFSTQPVTPFGQSSQHSEQKDVKETSKKCDSTASTAFANFFKKTDKAAEGKNVCSSPSKKSKKSKAAPEKDNLKRTNLDKDISRKRKADDEGSEQKKLCTHKQRKREKTAQGSVKESEENNLAGKLNLSSTSLILFDEVDLVFEEDSGFLQTVQHFINTTKIPIIMTTSDPGFQRQISARFETLVFEPPALELVASYLQTACLAAGLCTSLSDVAAVASLSKGDLRHALLNLQFLVQSWGGFCKELCFSSTTTFINPNNKKRNLDFSSTRNKSLTADDGSDSDGDFICLRPVCKNTPRILDNDEDSSEVTLTAEGVKVASGSKGADADIVASTVSSTHLYQSALGLSCNLEDLFNKCMTDEYNGSLMQLLTSECLKLQHSLDILQPNLMQLLPLPKTSMLGRWYHPPEPSSTSVKRKRIRSDVFDSEASDEEDTKRLNLGILLVDTASTSTKQNDCQAKNAEEMCIRQKQHVSEMHQEKQEVQVKLVSDKKEKANKMREVADNDKRPVVVIEACSTGKGAGEMQDASLISTTNKNSTENNTAEALDRTVSQWMTGSLRGSRTCTDSGLGSRLLSSFAKYYEVQSAADSHLCDKQTLPNTTLTDKWTLLPGTEDRDSMEDAWCGVDSVLKEICMELGVRSSRCLWQAVNSDVTSWKRHSPSHTFPDGCSVSVPQLETPSAKLPFPANTEAVSVPKSYKSVVNTVINNLPLTSFSNLDPVIKDYLPTLRVISQAEHCRQIAKAKRRFHHHFDSIGLCLNESTLLALCEEFPPAN